MEGPAMTIFLTICLLSVLTLWFVTLMGAAGQRDDLIRVISRLEAEKRDQALTITNQRRELARLNDNNVRPLRESPTADRIAAILAANEAQRFDPDNQDWSR